MADETLKDDDDVEIKVVEVDQLPEPGAAPVQDAKAAAQGGAEDDDDDEGDERLADTQDDPADREAAENKRKERRKRQKEARDRTLRELDELRDFKQRAERQLAELTGIAVQTRKESLGAGLNEAKQRLAQAEIIHARAIEAGNGEDAVAALKLRDEAMDQVRAYEADHKRLEETPRADPVVADLANEWKKANPWYDGQSQISQVVHSLESDLIRDGYQPTSRAYWQQLSQRTSQYIERQSGGDRQEAREERAAPADDGRRKGPPVGGGRSGGASSNVIEVNVTPERKAAMVEAGYWDDPKKRAKMLRHYAEFDRQSAAR